MSLTSQLSAVRGAGAIPAVAWHFADFVRRQTGLNDEVLLVSAALAASAVEERHVCLPLRRLYDDCEGLFPRYDDERTARAKANGIALPRLQLPEADAWLAHLRSPHCAAAICSPGDYLSAPRPLVLDDHGRLYLHRYYAMERELAAALLGLVAGSPRPAVTASEDEVAAALERLFPAATPDAWLVNWPKIAGFAALRQRLTVITGGPGTGKTTVVGQLLALLQNLCPREGKLRVRLAAPTGKAAARLGEALAAKCEELGDAVDLEGLQLQSGTVHRLLGYRRNSIHFRHDRDNPLAADLVIIDEASMVPLPMMVRILAAVGPGTRLILLGDMHQLASVDSGFVLGDLCYAGGTHQFSDGFRAACGAVATGPKDAIPSSTESAGPLADACVPLTYSWRFPPGSAIDRVSRAVNGGAAGNNVLDAAIRLSDWHAPGILLPAKTPGDAATVQWKALPPQFVRAGGVPDPFFWKTGNFHKRYADFLAAVDPATALDAFDQFRILCATNSGPQGVEQVNLLVEHTLGLDYAASAEGERRRLRQEAGITQVLPSRRGAFYDHRPIMITENNYSLELFNGDVGIILRNPSGNPGEPPLLAYFPAAAEAHSAQLKQGAKEDVEEGAKNTRRVRAFIPEVLPAHLTAWAMTIHKSQGSQFPDVLVVLPHRDNPVLGRELVYTAITRAAKRAELWVHPSTFHKAIARTTDRHSGLVDALSK